MAISQPVVFGKYEWATNLFADTTLPETFNVTLSDSMSSADADVFSNTKVLAETLGVTEAEVIQARKVLADTLASTAVLAVTGRKVLSDSAVLTDSQSIIATTKAITDFLVIKEWISINLKKQITWVNPVENANTFDSLWGKYKFGSVLFGGVKPTASWTKGATRTENWTQTNGHKYNY